MDPRDTLVITGTGKAQAAPDAVVLDLQLEGHGASVSEALAALADASRACEAALPGRSVRTHGLGVHPRHDHHGRQVGHTAYQQVRVRTDDPTGVGDVVRRVGDAVGEGFGVNGLRPEVSDTAPLETDAREAAMADARTRAEHYARLAGRSLGEVLWIVEPGTDGGVRPFGESDMRMAMAAGPAVDPADQEVTVRVQVGFALR
ncbi:SIMPL domain-containing protein [Ornithinimicrobium sp. Y1847]|uniref:SIMPL domain-containing protein n=1 Tax=Ornithinimicrobium sp. Y1847 TaxID=3405419 RepID=UPI003B66F82D